MSNGNPPSSGKISFVKLNSSPRVQSIEPSAPKSFHIIKNFTENLTPAEEHDPELEPFPSDEDNQSSSNASESESNDGESSEESSDSDSDSDNESSPAKAPPAKISLSLPHQLPSMPSLTTSSARPSLGMMGKLSISLTDLAEKLTPIDPANEEELYSKKTRIATYDKICSEITPQLFLGSDTIAKNSAILLDRGITHILNCAGAICPVYFPHLFTYKVLYLLDGSSEDVSCLFYEVISFIDDALEAGGRVFVHCQQGVSRSSAMLICYMMWKTAKPFGAVHSFVKERRNISNPNPGFIYRLLDWWNRTHPSGSHPFRNRLFRCVPHHQQTPSLIAMREEPSASPDYLDPRGVLLLHTYSTFFVWIGSDCLRPAYLVARAKFVIERMKKCHSELRGLEVRVVRQAQEGSDFWRAIYGESWVENIKKTYQAVADREVEYSLLSSIPEQAEIEAREKETLENTHHV